MFLGGSKGMACGSKEETKDSRAEASIPVRLSRRLPLPGFKICLLCALPCLCELAVRKQGIHSYSPLVRSIILYSSASALPLVGRLDPPAFQRACLLVSRPNDMCTVLHGVFTLLLHCCCCCPVWMRMRPAAASSFVDAWQLGQLLLDCL